MPKAKSAVVDLKLAKPKELKDKLPKKAASSAYLIAEPKLDGFRGQAVCIAGKKPRLYTSGGVEVVNGPLIVKALAFIHKKKSRHSTVYDGEFFCNNWNDTSSIVTTKSKHPQRKKLRFRIFDALTIDEWTEHVGQYHLSARKKIPRR